MTTFKDLGLNHDIMKSLNDLGFSEPTPIQAEAIPFLLETKKDLIALAQTGTGKTAAFALPILNQIKANERDLQAIIICPTRELCVQISKDIIKFAKHSNGVAVTAVYGGERIDFQIKALKRGTNIVVGTPGRVNDLIRRNVLKLSNIKWLVLDEADEMLDMGFKDDLNAILEQTPKSRQTMLFSATMSKSVYAIARQYMNEAEEISVGEKNVGAENVSHEYYIVKSSDRFEALKRILDFLPGVYGILFCRTRIETQTVADKLKQSYYDAEAMHGDISQAMRTKIMDRFRKKQIRLLVATDVAARGIDVSDLTHVINYNLPDQNEAYTHRSGRTGRAHKSGVSITIVGPRETRHIYELEGIIGKKFEFKKVPSGNDICHKQIDNFLEEIKATNIEAAGKADFFQGFTENFKHTSKEDIIKTFVTNKFNHLMADNQNTRDLNADAMAKREINDNPDNINLKINLGKRNRFDIKGLFSLLNSNGRLKGVEVGRISLLPEYSIFSVERRRADDVVRCLNGSNYRGTKIYIARTDESAGVGGGRERGGERSGDRKRGGGGAGFKYGKRSGGGGRRR
jgi:ATP-dependent RNA helicase DeaD